MSTLGKKWTRKDKKWTDEIMDFVKSVCPLRDHGINSRKELADEINRRFGRKFTDKAVCAHCYDVTAIQMFRAEVSTGDIDPLDHFRLKKITCGLRWLSQIAGCSISVMCGNRITQAKVLRERLSSLWMVTIVTLIRAILNALSAENFL